MTGKKQAIKKLAVVKDKPVYNASAEYQWDGNANIPILGIHFQEVYNGLKMLWQATEADSKISEAKQHIALFSALQSIEKTFISAVENGIVKEKK